MAQTQSHQFPQQTFSPTMPASSPSPGAPSPAGSLGPPAKRQRLSPLPQSPSQPLAPSFGTLQLPPVGSPINGTQTNGMSSNAPPPPPPGSMGPPSRPAEKAIDTAELTDVLAGSGIDVREEEAFLTSGYGPTTQIPQQPPRLQTNLSTSFASQPSAGSLNSAGVSFNEPTYTPTPIQPAAPPTQRTPEEVAADEQLRDDTAASRREQYHLQAPFLQTAIIGHRLQGRLNELGIRTPTEGYYRPYPNRPANPVEVTGPDGSSITRTGASLLTPEAPLGDIITLISLACEERLRSVVDNSASLAKNRRMNSHGVVPVEWHDLAVASEAAQKPTTDSPDGTGASAANGGRKRSLPTSDNPGTESNEHKKMTIPNTIAMKSRKLIDRDVSYEEKRAAKRVKRSADAILGGDAGRAGSVGVSASGAATPTGERAPDVEKKVTKKELKKAESKVNDAVQHQQAVEAARMATGLATSRFGGKKKTYSWLQGPSAGAAGSGFSTPSRAGATKAGSNAAGGGKGGGTANGTKPAGRRLGEWREDRERGAGIQIRDILFMLEVDGMGSKHLQKAYSRESKEDVDRFLK